MKKIYLYLFILCISQAGFSQTGKSGFKEVYISKVPRPTAPAQLTVSNIQFDDASGNANQLLDAGESANITFTLKNTGNGDAYAIQCEFINSVTNTALQYKPSQTIGNLESGSSVQVTLPIRASESLLTGKTRLTLRITEGNGFDANPVHIEFETEKLKLPEIQISEYVYEPKNKEGKLTIGETHLLKIQLKNLGDGVLQDAIIEVITPNQVFHVGVNQYRYSQIQPGAGIILQHEFFSNKQFEGASIPIRIVTTGNGGKYRKEEVVQIPVSGVTAITQFSAKRLPGQTTLPDNYSIIPDVDKDIPIHPGKYPYKYALIIGNEDYAKAQEQNVPFARNDARIFKEYCEKTLGIPAENIVHLEDATTGLILQEIDKLKKLTQYAPGKLELIFYYAGHGLPDENTKESYLIPVDVSGGNLKFAIKLNDLYAALSAYPSRKVTVFLDACFSGGARNQSLLATRGIRVRPKDGYLQGNMVVFSASSDDQSALPFPRNQHGMFTYFLLKKLQESKGQVSFRALGNYLEEQVKFNAVKEHNKEQFPDVRSNIELGDAWEDWKL
jgi:hypothetical protein